MVYQWNDKSFYWYSIGTNHTIGTNGRTESSCTQTEPYLNEMQFTNGVPMECQVILLVPIVPLVPMDKRNPAVLKQTIPKIA